MWQDSKSYRAKGTQKETTRRLKELALSYDDAEKLRRVGFTDYEINAFAEGKTPDGKDQPTINLSSEVWQRVMSSRGKWNADKIAKDWTVEERENAVMDYYVRSAERNPWDFLKAEYQPPLKKDYYEALRGQKKVEIQDSLGKYF